MAKWIVVEPARGEASEVPIAGDPDGAVAAAFPHDWSEFQDYVEFVSHGELSFKEWLERGTSR
jgi:hypothetical protein